MKLPMMCAFPVSSSAKALIPSYLFDKQEYLNFVYSALSACVCAYFRCVKLARKQYKKPAKAFLEKVNKLYVKLWSLREQTLDKLSEVQVHGYSMYWRLIYMARVADQIYLDC